MSVGVQGSRYVSTAVLSALSDWVAFVALVGLGAGAVAAQAASRLVGGVVAFALHKGWTYEARGLDTVRGEAARFLQLYVASYVLSLLLLHGLVDVAGAPAAASKLAADGACFGFNFVAMRVWVFGARAGGDAPVRSPDAAGRPSR